jgi:hypothetical protein
MDMASKTKIVNHLAQVEAMIDFYDFAVKNGDPSFRSAKVALDMMMAQCRVSLYEALEETEYDQACIDRDSA